jgi:hypothetical protein
MGGNAMITLTREEAHQLLVALQELNRLSIGENAICLPAEIDDAMEVLEARLAQTKHWSDCAVHSEPAYPAGECDCGGVQPEPEPVAWLHSFTGYGWQVVPEKLYPTDQPLYTAPITKMRDLVEGQGRDGTWNYDPYFHGMYNGMELMLSILEKREPVFREAPKKWLSEKEQG